ncbi:MAG: gluconate:H+ symporter [Bacteroidota bacterium]
MPLLIIASGILLLLLLTVKFKLNAFISFIVVSIYVGLALGISMNDIITSIQNGIGSTLGFLVLILGLGAMLGKLIAESGAAQRITTKLVSVFGLKYIQWALMLTGFIVGIPMFYSVGFVMMIPLVFTIAVATELPLLYVGLPMLASLSVTHGYLPPHPAPSAIATIFGANIGKTLIYGIIVAIPAIIVAGPLFSRLVKKIEAKPLKEFYNPVVLKDEELPKMWVSILTALLPVLLIVVSTLAEQFMNTESLFVQILVFLGNPVMAMLIAVLVAIFTLGLRRGKSMKAVMESLAGSVSSITMVLLVIAGAGALKQVLIDSGAGDYIGKVAADSGLSPLILAWTIATLLRVSIGSATVAGLTTAGILLPVLSQGNVSAELMVLAIGSGSLMLSHVNDSGFWLFKEYFNLSVKDTISSWTVMETTVGVMGLLGVLVLDMFI